VSPLSSATRAAIGRDHSPLSADENARLAALDAKRANGTATEDEAREALALKRRKLRALGIEDHQ
jgi:hypothetical protein